MNIHFKLFFGIVFISILVVAADYRFFAERNFHKIHFINVEQGDAILIRTKSNCNILIDGGGYNYLVDQVSKFLPALSTKIDLVILSHPHLDHLGGLVQILNKYRVGEIMLTGVAYNSNVYLELFEVIKREEVKPFYLTKNSTLNYCGIQIQTLFPAQSIIGLEYENVNNSSITLILSIGNQKIWLAGDAELEQESELIPTLKDYQHLLPIDIYKASHHGSRTSNSLELLKILNPKTMIIQAGSKNNYSHPHFETLQTANILDMTIYRTDLNGTVTFLVP